jgi:hypothetical protein
MLLFTVIGAIMILVGAEVIKGNAGSMDDDQAQAAAQQLNSIPLGLIVVMVMIQAVLYVFGIMGAIKYTKWMIAVALIGYALAFVANILVVNILGIILPALFAYPHFMFISELNQGIMTPDNYPNEVHSCCCV